MVSWLETVSGPVIKNDFGSTLQNQNPLVLLLVVPKPLGTSLARRDDLFDSRVPIAGQELELFFWKRTGQVRKDVAWKSHGSLVCNDKFWPVLPREYWACRSGLSS